MGIVQVEVNVRDAGAEDEEEIVEKDLIEYIVKALVDDPGGVLVNCLEGVNSKILELKVTEDDIGKVIGKHGRIVMAIRTILSASAARNNKRVILEILD